MGKFDSGIRRPHRERNRGGAGAAQDSEDNARVGGVGVPSSAPLVSGSSIENPLLTGGTLQTAFESTRVVISAALTGLVEFWGNLELWGEETVLGYLGAWEDFTDSGMWSRGVAMVASRTVQKTSGSVVTLDSASVKVKTQRLGATMFSTIDIDCGDSKVGDDCYMRMSTEFDATEIDLRAHSIQLSSLCAGREVVSGVVSGVLKTVRVPFPPQALFIADPVVVPQCDTSTPANVHLSVGNVDNTGFDLRIHMATGGTAVVTWIATATT